MFLGNCNFSSTLLALKSIKHNFRHKRDGVAVRASAMQLVDLGFVSQVKSYQKTLKNGFHSFSDWHSAQQE